MCTPQTFGQFGPNTPMPDIVDYCQIWERHREVEIQPWTSADRRHVRVIGQVTEVEPTPAVSLETETVVDMIKKLLPTPAPLPLQAVPIRSDRDLLIQQLMEVLCPPTPVAQERSPAGDLETSLLNWLPVGTVRAYSHQRRTFFPLRKFCCGYIKIPYI